MAKKNEESLEIKDQSVDLTPERTGDVLNSKAMLDKANADKRKIRYTDRAKIELTADFGYHKKGDIINPHKLLAEQYISQGVAKKA